jgi:hypothetical protein
VRPLACDRSDELIAQFAPLRLPGPEVPTMLWQTLHLVHG